jgi:ABC-2 type transport system ATP-binding protein
LPLPASEAAISISGVVKRYGRVLALDGIDLEVKRGELFALVGPNGAGKTTLLHVLCTIVRPDGGTAVLAGYDVVRNPLRARKHLGVVFQEPSLDDRLTVFENLNFHGLVFQVPVAERRRRIAELLEVVQLSEWRDRLVRTLSPGMKRRVEIARALVHDARILFLDEPTVGLDAQSRQRIWAYVGELRRERELTVVVTTHYIEEVDGCDRVGIIDHGKMLAIDAPEALKAAYGRELIRVVPRDEATEAAIYARFPEAKAPSGMNGSGQEIVLPIANGVSEEAFLSEFGSRVRQLTIDKPSLESVFLSLTGRELRDQAASQKELTFAFGKRGGEHTR